MSSHDGLHLLRKRTAESLAEEMNHAGILYVVVNGLYGYPERVGRDVDILIGRSDALRAIRIAERVARSLDWDNLLLRWSPLDTWQVFFIKRTEESLLWLEVDLMHEKNMLMGAAPLVFDFDALVGRPEERIGPFAVSRLGYYIKSQIRPICYDDLERFEKKYALQPVHDPEIEAYLCRLLGEPCARDYIARTRRGAQAMLGIGSKLKRTMNWRFFQRHPLRWLGNYLWSRVLRPWNLYWKSSGLVFAVAWPEGDRDASALNEAEAWCNGCFHVRRAQFPTRPAPRPQVGSASPGPLTRWWNAAAWLARLTAAHYLRDRFLPTSVIQFVLYDGSPGDLLRHPGRYGMAGGRETRWLRKLAPWPIEIEPPAAASSAASDDPNPHSPASAGKQIAKAMIAALEEIYAPEHAMALSQIETLKRHG